MGLLNFQLCALRDVILASFMLSDKRYAPGVRCVTLVEYRKSEPLRTCYLTKADLERLLRIVSTQAPEGGVTIATDLGDVQTIEAKSLDVFLAHPDLPAVLNNLEISTSQLSATQFIHISIGGVLSSYSVRSSNEVWVLGNFQRLQEFFRKHRGFVAPEWLRSPILLSFLIGGAVTLVVQLLLQRQMIYGFIAGAASAFVLVRYVEWAFVPLNNIGRIVLVETRSLWRTLLTVENISLLIAFLSLIAAIIPLFR